jgi:hypothetical protein
MSELVQITTVATVTRESREKLVAENLAQSLVHGRPHAYRVAADVDRGAVGNPLAHRASLLCKPVLDIFAWIITRVHAIDALEQPQLLK